MDLKQIEYILKIAEEQNITHAAEKLFITQSALNQQLLKLEKELGTPLFYRSRTDRLFGYCRYRGAWCGYVGVSDFKASLLVGGSCSAE